jgi:hypothetical protein
MLKVCESFVRFFRGCVIGGQFQSIPGQFLVMFSSLWSIQLFPNPSLASSPPLERVGRKAEGSTLSSLGSAAASPEPPPPLGHRLRGEGLRSVL